MTCKMQNCISSGRFCSKVFVIIWNRRGQNVERHFVENSKKNQQWPLAPNLPKWQITRANVSRRVTFFSKMVFGECRRVWRVLATRLGECRRVWRVRATRLGESGESARHGMANVGESGESAQHSSAQAGMIR